MLEIIYIAIIIVFCIDLSGGIESIKRFLWGKLYKGLPYNKDWRIKPWDCSLCLTFWISLLYLIIIGNLSLKMIAYVAPISFLTPVIKDIIILIKDIFIKLIDILYKWIA